MKKNLAKILASASFVVALILVIILLVTAFGGIEMDDFQNKLVRGLLMAIAILYVALATITIVLLFVQGEALHEVVIKMENGGNVRVNAKVFTKMIKKEVKNIEGVHCQKVQLFGDGYGVRLKLNVKIKDKDVEVAETYLRTLIEDMFMQEFRYHFSSIDVNIMQLVPKYKANQEEINAHVKQRLEQKHAEEAKLEAAKAAAKAQNGDAQTETPAGEETAPINLTEGDEEATQAPAETTEQPAPQQESETAKEDKAE